MEFRIQWPLILQPLSCAFFWGAYLYVLPVLGRRLFADRYREFHPMNERCFRQNILSGIHTLLSVGCLSTAVATMLSEGVSGQRLEPRENFWLYLDISLSLGYFCFSLPISAHMTFVLDAGFPYGSPLMVFHHVLVVVAQATYLLTGYPALYMAISGLLFEITNAFFIPHILMTQLSMNGGLASTAMGLLLVVSFTICRAVGCSVLVLVMLTDLYAFQPEEGAAWLAAALSCACLSGLLLISWYWYLFTVLPALHAGLQSYFGDAYYQAGLRCVPVRLQRFVWTTCSSEGREEARAAQIKFEALQSVRMELAELAAEAERSGGAEDGGLSKVDLNRA
jgi:hypothetical protein